MKRNLVVLVTASLVAACGASGITATAEAPSNTDPKSGPVYLWGTKPKEYHTKKQCDGTTLVYTMTVINGGGLAVIANSPECQ